MMPKTSVSPAAIRNSITPSCSPLSACSATRMRFIGKKEGARRAPIRNRPRPSGRGSCPLCYSLHLAVLAVGILIVGENGLLDLHHRIRAGRRAGDGLEQVEILDREVVV